jgi:hypothetical protein
VALTRLCPFCWLPLATECLCDDEPATGPGEDAGPDRPGEGSMQAMASGLTVKRTAALGARAVAERKLSLLRRAVRRALEDKSLGAPVVTVLREAMEASA